MQGKCAVVFGAGGSIGAAVAKQFASEGAEVFLAGRTGANLKLVAKEITAAGGQAHAEVVDASDEEAVGSYVESRWGNEARRIVDDAVNAAIAMAALVSVAVVDESGVIKEFNRMDSAPLVSVQTAIRKAYAAAAIGMPPDDFFTVIQSDPAAVASFAHHPRLNFVAGGLPVVLAGEVAGAVGVEEP
jgi:uncharacterized protein GlcG (DUF336 family)